jgi:AraC-like DNA-binding protein
LLQLDRNLKSPAFVLWPYYSRLMDSHNERNPELQSRVCGSAALTQVRTADIDEARKSLRHTYLPTELTVPRGNSLDARLQAVNLPGLTLGRLSFGGAATTWATGINDYYILIVLSGRAVNRWDGRSRTIVTRPGAAAVFAPGATGGIAWSKDCSQLCLKIDPAGLRRELGMMLDRAVRSDVVFPSRLNVATPTASSWLTLVRVLERDAGRPDGILGHRLAVANMEHLLIQGLLLTQPHTSTDELMARVSSRTGAGSVKQAIGLMEAHPEFPWTTGELARETGVSGRVLQKAFADAGELPPMAFLRQLRLTRVRAELSDQHSPPATVAAVARTWGFVHPGRFAHHYRQKFGETPSQTRRKHPHTLA